MNHQKRAKRLKPTGHSALIESMIQPAIVVGSTLMSAIAAYVLALDELARILDRRGTPSDWFIVALCSGMGFLIDMAIIVAATRYKMHAVRNAPGEKRWLRLAQWVLAIGLASETMTLYYFFVHLSARAFPLQLVQVADAIHAALAVSRSFLPPVVIAYFAAGVLPVMFDRADRNREIKSRTSANIMLLIDRLSEVFDTDDKAEMLRALGGQLMLDTYATYDETGRTSEDDQLKRDSKLLVFLARIHRLDWSPIAADVAPELGEASQPTVSTSATPAPSQTQIAQEEDASVAEDEPPSRPPTGPGSPARKRGVRTPAEIDAPNVVQMPAPPARRRRRGKAARGKVRTQAANNQSAEQKAREKWRVGMSVQALQSEAGISRPTAQKYHAKFTAEDALAAASDAPSSELQQSDQAAQ